MRRRGHLLKALRHLANDPTATSKQRLRACELLFRLETDREYRSLPKPQELVVSSSLAALCAKLEECEPA
jgi:hypothetical protein